MTKKITVRTGGTIPEPRADGRYYSEDAGPWYQRWRDAQEAHGVQTSAAELAARAASGDTEPRIALRALVGDDGQLVPASTGQAYGAYLAEKFKNSPNVVFVEARFDPEAVRIAQQVVHPMNVEVDADEASFPIALRIPRLTGYARRPFHPYRVRYATWGITLIVLATLALAKCHSAHAQTSPTLVRACPTQPTTTGFSACATSTWSAPSSALIVDAQRQGVTGDVWLLATQLVPTDRVFACQDATITAGPFKTCPTTLPGQTNNYLLATSIAFTTPSPPPTTNGSLKLHWDVPTIDSTKAPITQALGYQVFVRATSCATAGPQCQPDYIDRPPVADVATPAATVSLPAGPYSVIVEAYFSGNVQSLGPPSDEISVTVSAGLVTPAKVTGVKAN